MKVTIYTLSDPVSGRVRYVGLTRDLNARMRRYRHHGHTVHLHNWLQALRRAGTFAVVTIVTVVDDTIADRVERAWIAHYRGCGFPLLNYTTGGERAYIVEPAIGYRRASPRRGQPGHPHSPETRARMSVSQKLRSQRCNPGHPEVFRRLNESRRGIPLTIAHRAKLSAALKGRPKPVRETRP